MNSQPDLVFTGLRPCHRCGGDLYLAAVVPHPTMPGSRVLVLCPRCDANDPVAQELLAWFAVHGPLNAQDVATVQPVAFRWWAMKQAEEPGVPESQIVDDIEAWRRGEFDG